MDLERQRERQRRLWGASDGEDVECQKGHNSREPAGVKEQKEDRDSNEDAVKVGNRTRQSG